VVLNTLVLTVGNSFINGPNNQPQSGYHCSRFQSFSTPPGNKIHRRRNSSLMRLSLNYTITKEIVRLTSCSNYFHVQMHILEIIQNASEKECLMFTNYLVHTTQNQYVH
jgi:hypothetical protein